MGQGAVGLASGGAGEGRVSTGGRIRSLDFLRGVAILGMLIPNIPWHAGDSMSRVYEADFTSTAAWLNQYLLFDQRFLPIFCMLFGAGVLLLTTSRPDNPALRRYFGVRMSLLLLIGIAHAYILWPGDILITYAFCAPFLFLGRNLRVPTLLVLGLLLKSVNVVFAEWPGVYDATIHRVLFAWWVDYGDAPSTIVQAYAGSYAELFRYNEWRNQFLQWTALPYFRMWNALGLMFVGMAFFRLGILQGTAPRRSIRRFGLASFAVGAPLIVYGVVARVGFNPTVGPYLGFTADLPLPNLTFSIGCLLGSFAVLAGALELHDRFQNGAVEAVERVGRMALTNYLMHSAVFLAVFHGAKLFPFDALDHDVMLAMVVVMWTFQLAFSWFWLGRFRQGPIEGVWRQVSTTLSGARRGR